MPTWIDFRRMLVASGALLLLVIALTFAGSAMSSRETSAAAGSNCTYYSDASRTVVVGRFGKDCCNNTIAWGKKTQFSVCGGCFPCTPPPR